MGLAPGVVIRPVKTTIPKMGLPFELLAGKMQNIQQTKDAFDALAELKPKALAMKGDQELLSKYNQYVEKIAGSVADAFASGDATKAQRMLSAAKTQLTREWKEGGVATALRSRAEAMANGINEIAKRELGDDYKEMNKKVDLYNFQQSIKDIDYDVETGSFSKIGSPTRTSYIDLEKKAEQYGDAIGIDKTGYLDFIKAASGDRTAVMGLVHTTKASEKKINQQLQAFKGDPEVQAQMALEHQYKNIITGRLDDPNKFKSDAVEYLEASIEDSKTVIKRLESLPITQQKYALMNLVGYDGDFSTDDNAELKEAKEKYKQQVNERTEGYKQKLDKINGTDETEALKEANSTIYAFETADRVDKMFRVQFGVEETISNLKWPESLDTIGDAAKKAKEIVIQNATETPSETSTLQSIDEMNAAIQETDEAFNKAVTEQNSYYIDNKDNLQGFSTILDLEPRPAAKTEEDRESNILRFVENNEKITQTINILDSDDSDDVKRQSLKSLYNIGDADVDNIIKEYEQYGTDIKNYSSAFGLALNSRQEAYAHKDMIYSGTTENIVDDLLSGNTVEGASYSNGVLKLGNYKAENITPEQAETVIRDVIQAGLDIKAGKAINPVTLETVQKLYGKFIRTEGDIERVIKNAAEDLFENTNKPFTPINFEYSISKPRTTTKEGLYTLYTSIKDNIKANVVDFETSLQGGLIDQNGDEWVNNNQKQDLDKVLAAIDDESYSIGVSYTGEPYVKFTSVIDEERKVFKVKMDAALRESFQREFVTEVFGGYQLDGNLESLNRGLISLSRLEGNNLSTAFVKDQNTSSIKSGTEITLNVNGTDRTSNGIKLKGLENTELMLEDGSTVQGELQLYKMNTNNRWRYYITFNDEALPYLTPKDGSFDDSGVYYNDNFDTAIRQLLLYKNSKAFADVNVIDANTLPTNKVLE